MDSIMSLIKWNKDELFPSLDSMWGDFFNNDFFNRKLELGTKMPVVNVSEKKDSFHFEVAVPGLRKRILILILTISSEKEEEKDGEKVTRKEFSYSSFQRSFQLPENVKADDVSAKYNDGILSLDVPKKETTKSDDKKKN